jgi:hypothetical protein
MTGEILSSQPGRQSDALHDPSHAIAAQPPCAHLYRGTFALQQALYALRDGNTADFEDGIADNM